MKLLIQDNGFASHAKLLRERISERVPTELCPGEMTVTLKVDASIGKEESYCICSAQNEWQITGSCELGLYYGIGKFLHSAKWSENDFSPVATNGVVSPDCSLRIMYFSIHFYNWYHTAPIEELERYVEDMLLWGYNTIACIVPVANIDAWGDETHMDSRNRLRMVQALTKKYGMRTAMLICVNQGLKSAPHEYDSDMNFNIVMRGNFGRNLCLSKPDAVEYLRDVWRHELEAYEDIGLDYIVTWPYDEGGCGCAGCRPWGANKYLDGVNWLREEAVKYFPNIKFVVSTWAFDDPEDEGEYAGLYKRLKTDLAWVDYLMIDSHGDFPQFALDNEVIKPIINFPEISMWGLIPWGGFGANPLPLRFQAIWDSSKHLLDGGAPYSEGLYEDISKIQCAGYYWNRDASWQEILGEYVNYEYSKDVIEDTLELMLCIERNHAHVGDGEEPELAYALKGGELARSIDARLSEKAKTNWRWRILYIRAILDEKRYTALQTAYPNDPKRIKRFSLFSGDLLIEDAEAQSMFAELQRYNHSVPANGANHFTLPPLGGTAHWEEI